MGKSYELGRCCLVCGISVTASDFPDAKQLMMMGLRLRLRLGDANEILYTLLVTYMEVCMFSI